MFLSAALFFPGLQCVQRNRPEDRCAAQGYIGPYGGYSKVLSETLEYDQRTATQILNAIGADGLSAPSP